MTYDPNLPPSSTRGRMRDPDPTVSRSSNAGWMIALLILALVVIGAFFVWPNRGSNVAGNGSSTTSEPSTTGTTRPAPSAPSPGSPAPATPSAPR